MIARRFDKQLTHMRLGSLPSFVCPSRNSIKLSWPRSRTSGARTPSPMMPQGKVLAPVAGLRFINGWLMQGCKRVWVFGPEAIWPGCAGGGWSRLRNKGRCSRWMKTTCKDCGDLVLRHRLVVCNVVLRFWVVGLANLHRSGWAAIPSNHTGRRGAVCLSPSQLISRASVMSSSRRSLFGRTCNTLESMLLAPLTGLSVIIFA